MEAIIGEGEDRSIRTGFNIDRRVWRGVERCDFDTLYWMEEDAED